MSNECRWKRDLCLAIVTATCVAVMGCGKASLTNTGTGGTKPAPQSSLYFAPAMGSGTLATFALDNTANTFVRTTYSVNGALITDAGESNAYSAGIVGLEPTFVASQSGSITETASAPQGWAVEIPGQAALVAMNVPEVTLSQGGQISPLAYFAPAVPSSTCPAYTKPQTFVYVTLPKPLAPAKLTTINSGYWNPLLETAYGTVQITTTSSAVQFASVTQSLFPVSGGGGTTSNPGPATATAACSPSYYGQVISVPGTNTITSPGGSETITPNATIVVGPSGFLVEDDGTSTIAGDPYYSILGAGYGAIGLPQPSSDLTSTVVGAQYQGFITGAGSSSNFNLIGAFGPASSSQSSCGAFESELSGAGFTPSSNTVYGGEYPQNGAASSPLGTANCDVAVDLGAIGSGGNGLYTQATVYIGSSFPENGLGAAYSLPAVAVAGEIDGKAAIFLIGVDTTGSPSLAWGIYLLDVN